MSDSTSSSNVAAILDTKENMGNWFAYNAQIATDEIEGTRIIPVCSKLTDKMKAEGKVAKPNVYMRVPVWITEQMIIDNIADIAPFIMSYFQDTEDKSIKTYHKDGGLRFYTEKLDLANVLSLLEDEGKGGRINTAQVTEWFNDNLADAITETMALTADTTPEELSEEQQAKVTAILAGYLAAFVSLAGPKSTMSATQRNALTAIMAATESAETVMGTRFIKRFAKMQADEDKAMESLVTVELATFKL